MSWDFSKVWESEQQSGSFVALKFHFFFQPMIWTLAKKVGVYDLKKGISFDFLWHYQLLKSARKRKTEKSWPHFAAVLFDISVPFSQKLLDIFWSFEPWGRIGFEGLTRIKISLNDSMKMSSESLFLYCQPNSRLERFFSNIHRRNLEFSKLLRAVRKMRNKKWPTPQ